MRIVCNIDCFRSAVTNVETQPNIFKDLCQSMFTTFCLKRYTRQSTDTKNMLWVSISSRSTVHTSLIFLIFPRCIFLHTATVQPPEILQVIIKDRFFRTCCQQLLEVICSYTVIVSMTCSFRLLLCMCGYYSLFSYYQCTFCKQYRHVLECFAHAVQIAYLHYLAISCLCRLCLRSIITCCVIATLCHG